MPAKQTGSDATTGYEAELWVLLDGAITENVRAIRFGGVGR